jgi:hypothetical protein
VTAEVRGGRTPVFVTGSPATAADSHATVSYFDSRGEVVTDETIALAKRVGLDHFVRISVETQQLLNPRGTYYDASRLTQVSKTRGGIKYSFRKVKPMVFDAYLTYLKTGKSAFLRDAERSLFDA